MISSRSQRLSWISLRKFSSSPSGWKVSSDAPQAKKKILLPKNILILRHGNSLGNEDETLYERMPDWKIPLSAKGQAQAATAALRIKSIVGEDAPVYFYVSPYKRAKQTMEQVQKICQSQILLIREEPRLREQDFGNFQDYDAIQEAKHERHKFGRFFFRFPNGGESGADVFDRVSAFCGTFMRDAEQLARDDATAILVTHGITSRMFVMRWLHWSVEDFEMTENPPNCGLLHLRRTDDGYRLTDCSRKLINAPLEQGIGRGLVIMDEMHQHRQHGEAENFDSLHETAWGL